jgi:hypothetical protein
VRSRRRCVCLTADDGQEEKSGSTEHSTMVLAPCFYGCLHGLRHFVVLRRSPREGRCEEASASRTRREDGGIDICLDDARYSGRINKTG